MRDQEVENTDNGKIEHMAELHFQVQDIKTALKKHPLVDPFFISKYACSPYRACQHACSYCDGRAEKYYVEGDFEQDILIRRNLPDKLRMELSKLKERGVVHFASGVSDPYQPVEAMERLMEQCAEVMLESSFPASVLTKSSLVARDIDLWEKVHQKNGFCLLMTITFLEDHLSTIFEPGASPISERLATLKAFKARGIPVGVMAMPLLPYIADTPEYVRQMVTVLAEIGVDFIVPGELTLRPGRQKEGFFLILQEHFPQYVESYRDLFRENRASGRIISSYHNRLYPLFAGELHRAGISMFAPHRLYHGLFPMYYELVILMNHMTYLYSQAGYDIQALRKSQQLYQQWLQERIQRLNRSRKLASADIEGELEMMMKTGDWKNLLQNAKLAEFTSQIVLEHRIFDYQSLKLG